MNQLPNNHTPKGQTHTIMESPLWIGRLYSYWITFACTFFSMFWVTPTFDHLKHISGVLSIFILPLPLIVAFFIDKYFTQTFFMRDWEESKKMDDMSIRGIPIPKIREYIIFQITLRKKFILYPAITCSILMVLINDIEYILSIILILLFSIFIGALIRMKIGYDKFGFNSLYFKGTSEFKSFK